MGYSNKNWEEMNISIWSLNDWSWNIEKFIFDWICLIKIVEKCLYKNEQKTLVNV